MARKKETVEKGGSRPQRSPAVPEKERALIVHRDVSIVQADSRLSRSDRGTVSIGSAMSTVTTALALCDTIRANPLMKKAMTADRRDADVRALRHRIFSAGSALLVQLYTELFRRPDAEDILRRARLLQSGIAGFLALPGEETEIEHAIIAISNLMLDTRDPCHRSVVAQRPRGIFRRPYDAMPLIFPNGELRADGAFFPDIDLLEWRWLPLTTMVVPSADGEPFEEVVLAYDVHGNVPASDFFIWRGMSRAVAYKHCERKHGLGGKRRVKRHATIPGLHEAAPGQLEVHMPTHVAERVDRKTNRWSNKSATTRTRPSLNVELDASDTRLTRTERFLRQLATEGADTAYLRREWAQQIEFERRHNIYR